MHPTFTLTFYLLRGFFNFAHLPRDLVSEVSISLSTRILHRFNSPRRPVAGFLVAVFAAGRNHSGARERLAGTSQMI